MLRRAARGTVPGRDPGCGEFVSAQAASRHCPILFRAGRDIPVAEFWTIHLPAYRVPRNLWFDGAARRREPQTASPPLAVDTAQRGSRGRGWDLKCRGSETG